MESYDNRATYGTIGMSRTKKYHQSYWIITLVVPEGGMMEFETGDTPTRTCIPHTMWWHIRRPEWQKHLGTTILDQLIVQANAMKFEK